MLIINNRISINNNKYLVTHANFVSLERTQIEQNIFTTGNMNNNFENTIQIE